MSAIESANLILSIRSSTNMRYRSRADRLCAISMRRLDSRVPHRRDRRSKVDYAICRVAAKAPNCSHTTRARASAYRQRAPVSKPYARRGRVAV
jgi:hypothetical protein